MANQVIVTNTGNVQVALTPPPNVQVQISRAAIGTISNVPTANFANFAGNITVSAQPNITSLGTLTTLTSSGNITAPFFIGNVIGNISGNLTVPGTNTAVLFNQLGNAGASDALKFNYSSNVLTANGNIVANYFIGNGSQLTGIVAPTANFANFAGNANVANTANSVAVANVSGIGNIATVNLDGSTSNVLYGNGVWAPSGNPFDQNLNTTDSVTFSALRINGTTRLNDIVADDNTQKIVLSSNYNGEGSGPGGVIQIGSNSSDIGNEITINAANVKIQNLLYPNYDGTNGQVLGTDGATNLAWVTVNNVDNANYANFAGEAYSVAGSNVSGAVANATFANTSESANTAGTVTTNAQPNITSVGTLTGLVVGGDITPNANITYDLGNNTNRFKDLYLAGNSIILGAQTISANATSISFSGNLSGDASGLSNIVGANVTGQVGNALVASTVYTNAQPNITSLGNLTSLTVSGDAGIAGNLTVGGNISYVNVNNLVVQDPVIELGGGPNGAPLTTNDGKDRGTLLHYYTTQPIDAFMGWDNGNGEFAFGSNVTNNLDVMTFNTLGNVRAQTFIGNLTGIASSATVANSANAVAGANVSGAVAFAATANSVAVANVSGLGNIATTNFDGNASNVLYGNGNFYALPTVSNVANANYANFAGTAFSVSGSNVSGAVANATFADNAGNATIANSANSVAVANVSGIGNIATINLDGNVSNLLTGNGTFVAIPTVSANANYANFAGTVITNAQPNITSVGTLTSLSVAGNVTANYFIGNGSSLTNITGGNVTGAVAFATTANAVAGSNVSGAVGLATFATTANAVAGANVSGAVAFATTANSVAVANVSGIGNIATVNLTGSSSNVLYGNGVFAAVGGGGNTANANYANFAGNVVNASQSNITSLGTLISLDVNGSTNANRIRANGGGTLTTALAPMVVSTAWNNASANMRALQIEINDNGSLPTSYLIEANVNSTSRFSVTKAGNIDFAGVISGNGSGLTNLTGANITGTVSTANTANTANTVINPAQSNITSLGTLTSLSVTGTTTGDRLIVSGAPITTALAPLAISKTWNNASANMRALQIEINDTASLSTSYLIEGNVSSARKFSVTKAGNIDFAGVISGNGSGLSNLAVANITGIGNIATLNLNGNSSQVLYGNGIFAAVSGGGTPGGANTQLQFNANGVFGGISTVTWNGSNLSLGAVGNVKVTGGVNNEVIRTDGTGNLSFSSIAQTLLVGTRAGPYTVPITNYTFQVTTRSSGNVTVYVN